MEQILIFIFSILYLILAIKRIDWAVMLLITALPSYRVKFIIFSIPLTLLETMILISFAVWFFKNYKKIFENIVIRFKIGNCKLKIDNCKLNRYPFDIELILLLIISFAAAGIAGFSNDALGIWKAYFFEPALFFTLVINIFKSEKGIDKIVYSLSASALAVSLFAVYQKFTGAFIFNESWAAEETRRITSLFGYPNAVGLYLGPVILLLLGFLMDKIYFIKDKKIFNFKFLIFKQFLIFNFLIALPVILISLLSIYFAKSEGAIVGVAAALVVFGLLAGKKARWATLAVIVVAATGIMLFAKTRNYAVEKITLDDFSGQVRKLQWTETWEMLKDGRIITGSGLANYKKSIEPYHQEGFFYNKDKDSDFQRKIVIFDERYKNKYWQPLEIYLYPHNIILNFWTELGIAGMLLFVWIIGKYFVICFKAINQTLPAGRQESEIKNQKLFLGLIGAMIVIIVHGLVDAPYFKNDLAVMFWLFVAIMSLIKLKIRDQYE